MDRRRTRCCWTRRTSYRPSCVSTNHSVANWSVSEPKLVVLSASGKDWIGPHGVGCFVKLRLMSGTRAFVACIDTHDPLHWEIRVVQMGHTNSK